jgi:hypothetical protein
MSLTSMKKTAVRWSRRGISANLWAFDCALSTGREDPFLGLSLKIWISSSVGGSRIEAVFVFFDLCLLVFVSFVFFDLGPSESSSSSCSYSSDSSSSSRFLFFGILPITGNYSKECVAFILFFAFSCGFLLPFSFSKRTIR